MTDFIIRNEYNVVMVEPTTAAAKDWVAANVEIDGWQWLGPAFAVDHRAAVDLLLGIDAEGFTMA